MQNFLNCIHQIFSSEATLSYISFLALVAVMATYILDFRKRNELRNAQLLQLRENMYKDVLSDMNSKIATTNERIRELFDNYKLVKGGKSFERTQAMDNPNISVKPVDGFDNPSSPFGYLYGNTTSLVAALNIFLNHFGNFYDPGKEPLITYAKLPNALELHDNWINEWMAKIKLMQKAMNTSGKLLNRQQFLELRRLQPTDTYRHRFQDFLQMRRNKKVLNTILKSKFTDFIDGEEELNKARLSTKSSKGVTNEFIGLVKSLRSRK